MRTQLKLLLFLFVLGIAAGTMAIAYWAYKNVLSYDSQIAEEISTLKSQSRPPPDPGIHHFRLAADLLLARKTDEARLALYKLLSQYPRSGTTKEAKRIIGEMNLDGLYELDLSGGKKDHIVQPGENLLSIAIRHSTTLEAIARVNGLTSDRLQPGDHLFLIPMNFDLVIDTSSKVVTIMRMGKFFREYQALALDLRRGTKAPMTLEVASRSAIDTITGKTASPVSAGFVAAKKRIILNKKGGTAPALIISTPAVAKAVPVSTGNAPRAEPVEADSDDAAPETGLFLSASDLEEIYPLLRKGSTVTLVD